MKKSHNRGGDSIFLMKVEMAVSKRIFVMVLAEYFHSKYEEFPSNLTKTAAKEILKHGLFQNGMSGMYPDSALMPDDTVESYNELWEIANQWVSENYPYLNQKLITQN